MQCERHPGIETYVTCVKCGVPICYRCQVETPVGLRCRKCGRGDRLASQVLSPTHYLLATGASGVAGVAGGLALAFLGLELAMVPFLRILVMAGLGYLVAEAVARAVRGRRGRGLQVIAGGGVVLAVYVGLGGALLSLYGIIGALIALLVAVGRLR